MIRIAAIGDLPEIVTIYNQAVTAGFATADLSPVDAESRVEWFRSHDPSRRPIYVFVDGGEIKGWCSLSSYRPGRQALRYTAEISFYVRNDSQRRDIIGADLVRHALAACESLQIKNVFAIVLDRDVGSRCLLEKLGFAQWGFMPKVGDFPGEECSHIYYPYGTSPHVFWAADAPKAAMKMAQWVAKDIDRLKTSAKQAPSGQSGKKGRPRKASKRSGAPSPGRRIKMATLYLEGGKTLEVPEETLADIFLAYFERRAMGLPEIDIEKEARKALAAVEEER